MAAGQTIIAIALGAGLIASGVWFFKSDRTARGSRLIDEFWDIYGDVSALPDEARVAAARKITGGGGEAATSSGRFAHGSHSHDEATTR